MRKMTKKDWESNKYFSPVEFKCPCGFGFNSYKYSTSVINVDLISKNNSNKEIKYVTVGWD